MAEVKWIKIPSNFFEEERIKTLEKQQEADSTVCQSCHKKIHKGES
jgi:hypothetical protein